MPNPQGSLIRIFKDTNPEITMLHRSCSPGESKLMKTGKIQTYFLRWFFVGFPPPSPEQHAFYLGCART